MKRWIKVSAAVLALVALLCAVGLGALYLVLDCGQLAHGIC